MLILAVRGYVDIQNTNYHSAIAATRKWARLSEFPATASDITIKATGSMFTRQFTVTFVAPLEDINSWLGKSPGTKDVTPTATGSVRKYEIEPGGGAQHAELEVDEGTRIVKIITYWS